MKSKLVLISLLLAFLTINSDISINVDAQETEYQLQGMQTQERIP